MIIKQVNAWQTSDNTLFSDPILARRHQAKYDLSKLLSEQWPMTADAIASSILEDGKFAEDLHTILTDLLYGGSCSRG